MSIASGNLTFFPHPQKTWSQIISSPDGGRYVWQYARALLTNALQTAIPLMIPYVKPNTELGIYPDIPLTIPVGAQIMRLDFRLPRAVTPGDSATYGIELPKNCTLVGTTGENLKVSPTTGTTHTVAAPALVAANNAYTPNAGVVLARPAGQADQASPSLIQTVSGSPMTLQMTVSNAGNTAAGNGIMLSQANVTAYIYAAVVYRLDGDPIKPWNLDLPFPPG